MQKQHDVKCWPEFYAPIESGAKKFDLRKDDRKYAVGDIIIFHEFDDRKARYTERKCERRVGYMLVGVGGGCITPLHGLARGYVILGLEMV